MDTGFSNRRGKNLGIFVVIGVVILLVVGAVFYIASLNKEVVSPLPPSPSFEVIFFTPTPGVTIEPATPSATPKGQRPSVTPKPTARPTAKPTEKLTVTPTTATSSTTPTP